MKATVLSTLFFLAAACSCATVPQRPTEAEVVDMMESTVQIEVQVSGVLLAVDPETKEVVELPVSQGWVGSGVVYSKSGGFTSPITSKILTANHVLEAPAVGDMLMSPLGPVRIDEVVMKLRTRAGVVCGLQPLVLGESNTEDVATAEADCDAGRVAKIASKVPPMGGAIVITGHPQGFPVAVVTEGFVSGWWNGYLMVSAGAYGGNSGGPVWYNGEVVGLLVRGSTKYHHISLVVPLQAVHNRIEATP